MRYFYGMPTFFFTYSPDDIHGVLNIRFSIPQVNNEKFPANGSGLAAAIQHGESTIHNISVSPNDLRALLAKRPVAVAIFRLLTESVFTTLLGTPPDHSSKRTEPLHSRKPGKFH